MANDLKMLSEAMREKIRSLFPRYPSKRAVTLAGLAPGAGAAAVRPVPGDGGDRRAAGDHAGRGARHDELLRVLPAGADRRRAGLDLPVACRACSAGGDELLEHACGRLAIEPGQTTPDGKLTVEFAECLGICDFAPAALADDGRIYGPLDRGIGRRDARRAESWAPGSPRRAREARRVSRPSA